MTIHCVGLEINLTICSGNLQSKMEIAKSMMFLPKVSKLVNLIASPKQPQSLTGFAIAIHVVMSVITTIVKSKILEVRRLRMANNKKMPIENSNVERATEAVSVIQSGTMPDKPSGWR